MFPDGICRVTDHYYSKTIQFQDINYQLNQNEDKTAIFDGWCDFLNYFDSSVNFQLSFVNLAANKESYMDSIAIPPQEDAFNALREEYTSMLQNQLARGNNGLIKTKYITFGIESDTLKDAKPRLERVETDILNNFKRLGVSAETTNKSLSCSPGTGWLPLGCRSKILSPRIPLSSLPARASALAANAAVPASCKSSPRSSATASSPIFWIWNPPSS